MVFSGRTSRNGLLPSPGPLTRIVEGDEPCAGARIAGVTLRGAGFAGAPLIGPTALGASAGWEFAGGGAVRAIRPVELLRSGLASGLSESGKDRVVIAEDGAVGPTRAAESSGRAWRDCADADGVEVREVASPGRFSSAGEVASRVGIEFWVSQRRFPSAPRPAVSPTARLMTAKKNTTAAT